MKRVLIPILLFLILNPLTAMQYKGDKCILKSEYIYQPGDVPFPSCHASTIAESGSGLIAAWFGGTEERNPDVGIWVSRSVEGKWTAPVEVANGLKEDGKRYPCWNPVLFNSRGKLLLFYKVGPSPSTWWGEMITSKDGGLSWSVPVRLPDGIYGPIKNKPVMITEGELLCPSSTENEGWRVHMEFTRDEGATWRRTEALNDRKTGAIQPATLLHPAGRIQILCRSTISYILSSWSGDNGKTWSPLKPLTLPNPNSGIDAVTLRDGRQLLVYNHLVKGRYMLNVAISADGENWKAAVLLENDAKGSEFSYPAVIQSSDGLIHITYTWNRKLIKHVVIDPEKIESVDFINGAWPL